MHPAPAHEPTSERLLVETPENVSLAYRLAGPAPRLVAYLIDGLVRALLLFMLMLVLGCTGVFTDFGQPGVGLFLLFLFVMEWGYFVICETVTSGRTPGKTALGLRVVQERGYAITPSAALLRNLIRFVDSLPFVYGVGLLAMLGNTRFQRLGDQLARTIVVHERSGPVRGEPVIFRSRQVGESLAARELVPAPEVLAVIEEFHVRRPALPTTPAGYARGHALARPLALALDARRRARGDAASELAEDYPMAYLADVFLSAIGRVRQAAESPQATRTDAATSETPAPMD